MIGSQNTTHSVATCPPIVARPQGWRYVPGAQIFAQCTAGDGSNSLVLFKAWVKPRREVKRGSLVFYKALVKNIDKSAVVQGLALTVQLPVAGVVYLKSKTSHAYRALPTPAAKKGGAAKYDKAKGLRAVVNYTASPQTVTWHDLVLPPRKGMRFSLAVRVNNLGVYGGMPLTFSGGVYQQLPVNGLPYCGSAYANQTIFVK